MKRKLLLSLLFATTGMVAQTTHMINWYFGVPSSESNVSVNNGDTVEWMLTDTMQHTVTTLLGSAENFDSGNLAVGSTYSHTFTTNGNILYYCKLHTSMLGIISVSGTAGVDSFTSNELTLYPNPTNDIATIKSNTIIENVEVFTISGQKIFNATAQTDTVKLYLENYPSGTYFVKVSSGSSSKEFKVIKK